MDWTWPLGLAATVFLLAGAATLTFGRRLALHRERNGYVRAEDLRYGRLDGERAPPTPTRRPLN